MMAPGDSLLPNLQYNLILLLLINFECSLGGYTLNANNAAGVESQFCVDAPTEAHRILCQQLRNCSANARRKQSISPDGGLQVRRKRDSPSELHLKSLNLSPAEHEKLRNAQECKDRACLCLHFGGLFDSDTNKCLLADGIYLERAVRKEYRMLSDEERERLHAAFRAIKLSGIYDFLTHLHSDAFADGGGSHAGPSFLPWHREFTKRCEILLRLVDYTVAIPYWDSTLDGVLPNPAESFFFSEYFVGDTDANNYVVNGAFSPWATIQGNPYIKRNVGERGACIAREEIEIIMQQHDIMQCLGYSSPESSCPYQKIRYLPEIVHGVVHIFCGGDMFDQSTSANDVIFYFHHCFMDMIWEVWRQSRQNRTEREYQYPSDDERCAPKLHFKNSPLDPFEPLRNIDALKNYYTDEFYEYAPRPTCDEEGQTCGSKYLFCDRSQGAPRCVAKVRPGGRCDGFEKNNEEVCMFGTCSNGKCVRTDVPVRTDDVTTTGIDS